MSESALRCQKAEFQLPGPVHYLNSAYMGPMPRSVEQAGLQALARRRDPTGYTPADFFDDPNRLRALFAGLVGAPQAERVAIHPAVSYAIATAARNLPLSRGDRIVILDSQFPSNVYAWRRLAQESDAEVHVVERPPGSAVGREWNSRILDAISPATRIVALPQVHWTDGTWFDLVAVGARARECNAALIVDATQSAGMVPLDFQQVRPDLYTAAVYKWMLGPYGMTLTWLGPRFDQGRPLEETWLGREGSEDFRTLVDGAERYRAGAERYDMGQRSSFGLMPVACAALEMMTRWRPERLAQYVAALLRPLIEQVRELGYSVEDDAWRGPHLAGLRMPEGTDLAGIAAALSDANVFASLRGNCLRISPHIYNTDEDMAALLQVLQQSRR